MSNINQISPDGGTTLYDIEDTDARSDISSLQSTKANVSDLGTSAYKNSTSVVTDSSDLVESGAVKDIVGWGNKNKLDSLIQGAIDTYGVVNPSMTNRVANNAYIPVDGNSVYTVSSSANVQVVMLEFTSIGAERMGTPTWNTLPYTFTTQNNINYVKMMFRYSNDANITPNDVTNPQMELGSTATAYEPYHASVEESLAEKCDNSVIGTVEDGTTASQDYAVGEHFIRDGAFCTVTQAISQGGSFTLNTNYVEGVLGDVIYRKYAKTITLDANSQVSITIPGITGYTVVQVTIGSYGSGTYAYFEPIMFQYSNTFQQVVVRNRDSANSRTWDILLGVTYVKSDSVPTQILS